MSGLLLLQICTSAFTHRLQPFYLAIEMLKHPVHTVSHLGMNIWGGGGGGGGSCQYKPRLAQMFRNGKTANPIDAMLQLAQSILNIGFTLVKRWDRGK